MTFAPDDPLRRACYQTRLDKTRAAMRAQGIELLIVYGNGRHSFLAMNPAWWLTGLRQMGPHLAVLLPLDGAPQVIATPVWDRDRIVERCAIEAVICCEPAQFMSVVESQLGSRNYAHIRVGVSGGGQMPRAVHEAWRRLFGGPVIDADKMISDIARVRDAWSLKCTRAAVVIAEQGYDHLLSIARPGLREHQVAAELEGCVLALGAEDNFQILSASQHNRACHRPTNRILAEGDILLGEITPSVEGEFAQICRTAVLGEPSAAQHAAFDLLDSALRAGMRAARPGVTVADVVEAIHAPIVAAGYQRYTVPPYMRTRGHSMAMGSMDPEIALGNGQVLAEGVMFVMHPNQYLPETGYLMCGEPVLIGPDGAVPLTSRMGRLHAIRAADLAA
jgi:Xaa-Pro aminopeptidase